MIKAIVTVFTGVVGALIGLVITALVVAVLIALPVEYLWNWTLPALFGFKFITFQQAFLLSLLTRFLLPSGSSSSN